MNSFRRCQYGYKIFGQFNPCFVKIGFGCVVATGDKLGRAICQECKRKVSASDHGRTTSWSKPCAVLDEEWEDTFRRCIRTSALERKPRKRLDPENLPLSFIRKRPGPSQTRSINGLEPKLTRQGYNAKVLADLLNVKPREIKSFPSGHLAPGPWRRSNVASYRQRWLSPVVRAARVEYTD